MRELEASISGKRVVELTSWASLWGDLLHVDMALHALQQTEDKAQNVFARRALWEGAVIAYGRTAKAGRRQVLVRDLIAAVGGEAASVHDHVLQWRDKHVAHRQDASREAVKAWAVVDAGARRAVGVHLRIAPATVPEDDFIDSFQRHVFALRNAAWAQRIVPLEREVLADYPVPANALMERAGRPTPPVPKGFAFDVYPSREPTQI
jgi:hypothetical protein